MATSDSSSGLKAFLAFFVFLTFVLAGFLAYTIRLNFDADAAATTQAAEASSAKNARDLAARQLEAVHEKIGIKDSDPTAVLAKLNEQIEGVAGEQASGTVTVTIVDLQDKLNNEKLRADELQKRLDNAIADMQNNDKINQEKLQTESEAKQQAQKELTEVQNRAQETVDMLQKRADDLQESLVQLQSEFDEYRDSSELQITELQNTKRNMTFTINQLQDRLAELLDLSFEQADGKIIRTDYDNNLVWINIGSAQGVKPQTRFSVYVQKNRGVARGTDEVKGAIEVTEVLDENLSVASIIDEDIGRPIAADDPIYSPAWSAGGNLAISVVGIIDLDRDGFGDRDRFHELVKESQAVIDNEVDDKGNRTGDGISVNTKFLVVGEIPEVSEIPTGGPQYDPDVIKKITEERARMLNEAREQGVRVISLQDFLQYIGYRPTERIWMRTSARPWNLKHGQRFSDAALKSGKYHSTGQVSGIYTRSGKLPPYESSGRVSGYYRKVEKDYP